MIIKESVVTIDGVRWEQKGGSWFDLAGMYYVVLQGFGFVVGSGGGIGPDVAQLRIILNDMPVVS